MVKTNKEWFEKKPTFNRQIEFFTFMTEVIDQLVPDSANTMLEMSPSISMFEKAFLLAASIMNKEVESLIIVILVFALGMLITRCLRIQIQKYQNIVIDLLTVILSVAYLAVREISVSEFIRKLLVLHLPVILYSLGFVLSLYQSLIAMMFLSIVTTILHTELESSNDPCVIAACAFFSFFHLLIFKRKSQLKEIILFYENKLDAKNHWCFVIFLLVINIPIVLFSKAPKYILLLSCFYCFFFIFSLIIYSIIFEDILEYDNIITSKLSISALVITGCTSLFIYVNSVTSVIYSTLVWILPVIYKYRFFTKNKVLQHENVHYTIYGDLYKIDWVDKTASLVSKGNKNNILPRYVMCEGMKLKIVKLEYSIFDDYRLKSFVFQYDIAVSLWFLEDDYIESVESVIFDYDFIWEKIFLPFRNMRKMKSIGVTSKCNRVVSHSNLIFSRYHSDLCFCQRNARSVFLNESLRFIKQFAFQSCVLLKCIDIPSSVTKIDYSAFCECTSLCKVTFREDSILKSIGSRAFYGTALRSINIPCSLRTMGDDAFGRCSELEKIVFPLKSKMDRFKFNFFDGFMDFSVFVPKCFEIPMKCKKKDFRIVSKYDRIDSYNEIKISWIM